MVEALLGRATIDRDRYDRRSFYFVGVDAGCSQRYEWGKMIQTIPPIMPSHRHHNHPRKLARFFGFSCTLVLLVLLLQTSAMAREIRIGVLSHRGDTITEGTWRPTAEYLTGALPEHRFVIVPLDFSEVEPAVAGRAVDFILVNSGIYVTLEVRHRISRIATMRNRLGEKLQNVFGGVIFTRADRDDLATLSDLAGRSFMAVDPTSLGGFQMAWGELKAQNINPYDDFSRLIFGGIHDKVVMAVLHGDVDAGTVRTDILERMAAAGTIDLDALKVLGVRDEPDFPFLLSTPLYPEWPFSKLRHTDNGLAQRVAVALLQMPVDHPAALSGRYAGWTVPLDYQPVHHLLSELRLPPYDQDLRFTLADALARYWLGVLLGILALLIMGLLTSWVMRLNQRLSRAKARLEQQQELILNSVAEGIYGVDLSGRCTFVNTSMVRMTGWRAADIIGANQHELLHHSHADGSPHPAGECPVYATFRDNRPRFVDDDVFWRRDGSSFPVEYSSTPIRDEQGKTVGSVVVFRDVTERKEAEERLHRHQLEQAHVSRLSTLGEMASGIAHELNQPLTAIATNARACVRMLDSGCDNRERCGEVMEKIAAQAERAGEVIRHIRAFARKEEPVMSSTPVAAMFDTVVGLLREDALRHRIALAIEREDDADRVMAQQVQIEQAVLNLARNAVEAMLENPPERARVLRLAAHRQDSETIRISVTDTGPGLDPEQREHLFEPFVTTKPQGLGLGLSISAGIVEAHGGRLQVSSSSEAGADFHFTLPMPPTGDTHGD